MLFGHNPKLIAQYMLKLAHEQQNPLTPMQVLKLVYIAHGWNLGINGRPLEGEPVEAWQYGPVIPSLYHAYKPYRANFISDPIVDTTASFDAAEKSVMDQVWKGYGRRTGISLSSLTHELGTPWSVTVEQSGIGAVISNDLIEDYYRRLAKG